MNHKIDESIRAHAEAKANLSETVNLVGLIEVYEATFDRCLEVKGNHEDAVLFAHEVFLKTMKHWITK